MADELSPIGSIIISGISGSEIKVGDITVDIKAAGDIVGRDKIEHTVNNFIQHALSAVEEADKARAVAARWLATGVRDYSNQLHLNPVTTISRPGNPYFDLKAYHLSDAALFFGRNQAIGDLRQHLERGRLTILQAESGAGKTSLLRAGLSPHLLANGHLPVYLRPYSPHQPPALAIKRTFLPNLRQQVFEGSETSQVYTELTQTPLRDFLRQVTAVLGPASTVCLLLDQFEECFTLLPDADRTAFVAELADCLDDEALNARWVLALRSEFFGDLATFRPYIRSPFENYYRLNRLRPAEALAAIIAPAGRQKIEYEPGLLDALLADMAGDGGQVAPPQLQLVCSALYGLLRERQADNPGLPPVLTLDMYRHSGRAQGILGGHLHRVLTQTLTPPERDLARRLLIALVSSDQRRLRRTRSDLAAELAVYLVAGQSLNDLLERLVVEGRLLNVDEDELTDEPAYELAHDYLLAEIQLSPEEQLRKAAGELLKQAVNAFKRHYDNGRPLLLGKEQFDLINSQREFLHLDADAEKLLQLSQDRSEAEAREKEAQRQRELEAARKLSRRAKWIMAVGAAAIILAIIAGWFGRLAEIRREEAEQQARRARSGQLAAQAQVVLTSGQSQADSLALMLAREAVLTTWKQDRSFTIEADATLREAVFQAPAWHMTLPRRRHTGVIWAVAFSPDGQAVVSASGDQTARLWDVATGLELRRFIGHTEEVLATSFSPDGQLVATAGGDHSARLWDTATGAEIRRFDGHQDFVRSVVFSPDGHMLLTASDDQTARLWEAATGKEIRRFEGHTNFVWVAAFSPDGRLIVTTSGNPTRFGPTTDPRTVRLWNARTGEEIRHFKGHTGWVHAAAFSPDGQTLVTAGDDKTARLWNVATGTEIRRFEGHSEGVWAVAFSPDGRNIVTAGADATARLWDVATGAEVHHFEGHVHYVLGVAFNPQPGAGGTRPGLVTAGADNTVRLWDITTGLEIRRPNAHTGPVWSAALDSAGQTLVTASDDQTARLWDVTTGFEIGRFEGHTGSVRSAAFSPGGQTVVTASQDQTARLWDVVTRRELRRFEGHTGPVFRAAFSPDGQTIVTASDDHTVRLWAAATGAEIGRLEHSAGVGSAAFSPDGQTIVTAGNDQTARLWDVATQREFRSLEGHTGPVLWAAFCPGGQTLVTTGEDGTARLWDVATGAQTGRLAGHLQPVRSADCSPDGKTIVTASDDGTARVWDAAAQQEIRRLEGHLGAVNQALFSRDGQQIITAGADYTARLWDVVSPGIKTHLLTGHTGPVWSVSFSPDGQILASASDDRTVRLWSVATAREIGQLVGHTAGVTSAAFNLNGQIVTASDDQTARLWDAATGRELRRFTGHTGGLAWAGFSPGGQTIVTAGDDQTTRLWDAATGQEIRRFVGHAARVRFAAFSPDGLTLVTTSDDRTACLWNVATGAQIRCFVGHLTGVTSAAFSPDGHTLVTASEDHTARLWDIAAGVELHSFKNHTDRVLAVAYDPAAPDRDYQWIVTAGADETVRLWEATTRAELRRLEGHTGWVQAVTFSPDGRIIATGGEDHTVRLWVTHMEDLLSLADALTQREPPLFTTAELLDFEFIDQR